MYACGNVFWFAGARLDLVDVNGRSALHAAAMKGQLQNAQCILEGGDDLTALALLRTKDKWDITPAQLAKLHGQNAMVSLPLFFVLVV